MYVIHIFQDFGGGVVCKRSVKVNRGLLNNIPRVFSAVQGLIDLQPRLSESWCSAECVTAILPNYNRRKCPRIDPKGQKVDRQKL